MAELYNKDAHTNLLSHIYFKSANDTSTMVADDFREMFADFYSKTVNENTVRRYLSWYDFTRWKSSDKRMYETSYVGKYVKRNDDVNDVPCWIGLCGHYGCQNYSIAISVAGKIYKSDMRYPSADIAAAWLYKLAKFESNPGNTVDQLLFDSIDWDDAKIDPRQLFAKIWFGNNPSDAQ